MDFGSSHVFTQLEESDTEELTAADFESPYGVYQPLGSHLSEDGAAFTQAEDDGHDYSHLKDFTPETAHDPSPGELLDPHVFEGEDNEYHVLYDNVIRDTHGPRTEEDDPIYDNRGFKPKTSPLKKITSADYRKPYDQLKRQTHPYEYAGPGSFTGGVPPPLPPMRKKETDDMENPVYEGLDPAIYQALIRKGSSKVRRADTNIVAVKFDKLVQSENAESGSPLLCGCCGAGMSHLSKISKMYSGRCWVCEFCEFENPVGEDVQVPTSEDSTYTMGHGTGGDSDTLVIFCVDVSGSMAVTTEVSGNVERRINDEQVALQTYQEELNAAEQRARQAEQEATHAEMMSTYQSTIDEQAQALAQYQISRSGSTAPPPVPPSPTSSSAATAPPLGTQGSVMSRVGVAQSGGSRDRAAELEDRYVAAPTRESQIKRAPPPPPPETRAPVSYISRLQSMQSAIQQQVTKLQAESGCKRVGLVAFNNNVTVIGDGSLEPVPLEGAGLTDKDSLISLGQNFPLPGPIAEVHQCLTDKIFSLTESGQTALGPALMIAIAMAAQKPGSKVIMCTDGMANVGLGALHNMDNDAAYEAAATFYEEVGDFARDAGVCVSVLTLEGEDCRAIELGSVADKTKGKVSIVRPSDLNQEFADILADPVLATNVSAKMVLHKGLFLRDSDSAQPESQSTHLVGLVTADSETTFEFGVRRKEVIYDNMGGTTIVQREEEEPIYESVNQTMIDGLERLPFQVQIRYTGRDGLDYLRVLTMDRPITKDRKFAEQNANVGVIGAHAAQSAARLAVDGQYAQAQINAIVTQKLVERCTKAEEGEQQEGIYQTFLANMAPIQSELNRAQQLELTTGPYMELELSRDGRLLSDGDSESDYTSLLTKETKISKKKKQRRKNVSDRQASVFYKMKGATTKMFNKQAYNIAEVV